MLRHYSHVRLDAKRNALDALVTTKGRRTRFAGKSGGYDTSNDTKVSLESVPLPHVIDSLVELSGIEPLTSSLRTRRSPS